MPSSISSFNRQAPSGQWGRVWLLALFAVVLILGGMEVFWRSCGHTPTVVDDPELWSLHRSRVMDGGKDTIVLLGASRIQLDLSMDTLREIFPESNVLQLAIDGKHPLAALRDLAGNTAFSGVVLCSITSMGFQRQFRDDQDDHVEYYRKNSTLNTRLNRLISSVIQGHLVIVDPYLKVKRLIDRYIKSGRFPAPRYLITLHDRSRLADYSMINIEKQYKYRIKRIREIYAENPPVPPEEWRRHAAEIRPFVEKIEKRGGRVVFIRLPSSGEHWEIDEQFYPRTDYWDRLAGLTGAITIHFKDIDGMEEFNCPEGSHLDRRDAPGFTRILAAELIKRGIIYEAKGLP